MPSNEGFFQDPKKAAAVLKHGILRRYLAKFAGATATTAPGRRVAFIDGFAGEGEYRHPVTGVTEVGSPRIALTIAQDLRSRGIKLECTFVEKRPDAFAQLKTLVDSCGDRSALALQGDISDHYEDAIRRSANIPTLVFLDPFGRSLDHDRTVAALASRGDAVPTELLLNFSLQAVRRMGARLYEDDGAQGRAATLANLDSWLGGDWWRAEFLKEELLALPREERAHPAALAVWGQYAARVRDALGYNSYDVEIRRKPTDKPLFMLALFFPRINALYSYNDHVSLAAQDWRKFLAETEFAEAEALDKTNPLLGESRLAEARRRFADDEEATKRQAIDDVKDSVTRHLGVLGHLHVSKNLDKVLGAAVGIARETHIRAAWKELAAEGVTSDCPKGTLEKQTIWRA